MNFRDAMLQMMLGRKVFLENNGFSTPNFTLNKEGVLVDSSTNKSVNITRPMVESDQWQVFENRQSGRTTRMINNLISSFLDGRACYVLSNATHLNTLKTTVLNLAKERLTEDQFKIFEKSVKFETPGSLGVKQESHIGNNPYVDFVNKRLKHAHPNCQLFIDHYFYEQVVDKEWKIIDWSLNKSTEFTKASEDQGI